LLRRATSLEHRMRYAEVSVNSPAAQRRTFSYSIPPGLAVEAGQAVLVPFGSKLLQGVVLELSDYPAVEETKDIADVIEQRPVLTEPYIKLARWISEHYLSDLFDAVALMLPPGFERKALTFLSASLPGDFDVSSLSPEQQRVIGLVRERGKVGQKEIEKALGQKNGQRAISSMVRRGLLERSYELEPIRAKPKTGSYLSLAVDAETARREAEDLRNRRAARQAEMLDFLAGQSGPVPLADTLRQTGISRAVVEALVGRNLVAVKEIEIRRDPLSAQAVNLSYPLSLTAAQKSALDAVSGGIGGKAGGQPAVFLLRGVTGSGKTEVYLQSLAEAVRLGKRGIVLVPEIALTPQTIERFISRCPGRVAVLHSQLSLGEQFDEWHRIRNGEVDVVIGPRSAVFAPQPDLGLIVIDEEHEWTYKQQEVSPRYRTRDVAVKIAGLTGAAVVMGSATPDVESYYLARRGVYRLLELPQRVTPRENTPLPEVEVVDLREELKAGNRSMFSRSLAAAVNRAVGAGEQVMLFLNRRGAATFIQCRDCGHVVECRRCESPMTYHLDEDMLVCHLCNYRMKVPQICPECGSKRIKFLGVGTQKLEQEAARAFPGARLLRWDSDVTRGKDSHREILEKFRSHRADILIGTQMITKGLDLPMVTLVGVVNADTSLNLPDFRAGERTFQLLSQVAGRAGRGPLGGQVIIQTYSPEHYAVRAAAGHDYAFLYNKEIDYRRQLRYPPFSRLASLVYFHKNDIACRREAERMKDLLNKTIESRGIEDIGIIGPAPAFVHRLRGRFRWQIVLRGADLSAFLSEIPFPQGWTIDIDPVGL
jgi:primosomal protein N' (replication factor Y)